MWNVFVNCFFIIIDVDYVWIGGIYCDCFDWVIEIIVVDVLLIWFVIFSFLDIFVCWIEKKFYWFVGNVGNCCRLFIVKRFNELIGKWF